MKRSHRLSGLGAAVLAVAMLGAMAPQASAGHDVYPPGWNRPDPNVPAPLFDFRAGWGWNDYQRYWPEQTVRNSSPSSRPIDSGPAVYTMAPGGHRYHQNQ
jgi:hypothetical protein